MKRLRCIVLCAALLLLMGCQSIQESSQESKFMPQINPYSQNTGNMQSVTLYFPVADEPYLSSYTTTIEVHADTGDTLQDALMRELIKGPLQGLSLDSVFTQNLRKESMQRSGNLLTIVLTKDLLTLGDGTSTDSALKKKLAIYAIVNTMTKNGDISQVQILVDTEDNGKGKAPSRQQVGFVDSDAAQILGPLGFSNSLLLTPSAAAQIVLDAGKSKDAERMLRILASNVLLPDEAKLKSNLQDSNVLIVDYFIANVQLNADNVQATVYVDIKYELMDESIKQVFNQPITLKRERSLWKVDYQSVEPLLFP